MSSNNDTVRPKSNQRIQFELKDGATGKATVLSNQPKRIGKWGDWVNVQLDGDSESSSINWKNVKSWKPLPATEKVVLLSSVEKMSQGVLDAKYKEIDNLVENNVFDVVPDTGQRRISTKWVITEKIKNEKKIIKARLVARGFEEKLENTRTDSPTCSRMSLRLCFTICALKRWEIQSFNVTSAFLQGNNIEREVYVKPPSEWDEADELLWKLKRCLYGLNDAPRAWYKRVVQLLVEYGGKASIYDAAVFLWHEGDSLIGMTVVHVDDFVYCGTVVWHKNVIDRVYQVLKIGSSARGSFKYIGLEVSETNEGIFLAQHLYVKELETIPVTAERAKQKDEPLTREEKAQLRSVGGKLLWATTQTRADCAYDACSVSNSGKEPTVKHLLMANKAIKKIKGADVSVCFPNLGKVSDLSVVAYSDAAHANLPSGASQGGMIIFLAGNGKVAPITWQSKKLDRVVKSPLGAETMALAEAADSSVLVVKMVEEILKTNLPAVTCYTDSQSLVDHMATSHVIQDKRLRIDIARLKEMAELKEIDCKWISKDHQLADTLTKAGASSRKLIDVLQSGRLTMVC